MAGNGSEWRSSQGQLPKQNNKMAGNGSFWREMAVPHLLQNVSGENEMATFGGKLRSGRGGGRGGGGVKVARRNRHSLPFTAIRCRSPEQPSKPQLAACLGRMGSLKKGRIPRQAEYNSEPNLSSTRNPFPSEIPGD